MKDYKLELSKGLYLEDYDVLIELKISQKDLLEKIGNIKSLEIVENIEFNVIRFCVQSNIFDSSERFAIAFNFVKGKMTSISLGKETLGLSIEEYFAQIQSFLESKFGKPKGIVNFFGKIFKEKDDKIFTWSFNNIKIVHSLFDCNNRSTLDIII